MERGWKEEGGGKEGGYSDGLMEVEWLNEGVRGVGAKHRRPTMHLTHQLIQPLKTWSINPVRHC